MHDPFKHIFDKFFHEYYKRKQLKEIIKEVFPHVTGFFDGGV